jgi:hypothetical protein
MPVFILVFSTQIGWDGGDAPMPNDGAAADAEANGYRGVAYARNSMKVMEDLERSAA